jgi:hypothetical protein
MKQVKAMYLPHTILARKISLDLTFRTVEQPFGILVAFDEGPLRQGFPPVSARNYGAERVAHALTRGH